MANDEQLLPAVDVYEIIEVPLSGWKRAGSAAFAWVMAITSMGGGTSPRVIAALSVRRRGSATEVASVSLISPQRDGQAEDGGLRSDLNNMTVADFSNRWLAESVHA